MNSIPSPLAAMALALLVLATHLPGGTAQAQPARTSVQQDIPISINANTMTYDPDRNRVVFQGEVEVIRAEFHLWATTLTLHMKPAGKSAASQSDDTSVPLLDPSLQPGDLDKIVAEKNVRFRFNTQSGTAAKATYTLDKSLLVLEGNPTLKDGENSITGSVIRYFLNENRSEVESGPQQRVEAIFGGSLTRGQ